MTRNFIFSEGSCKGEQIFITDEPEKARFFDKQQTPFVFVLIEKNRKESLNCAEAVYCIEGWLAAESSDYLEKVFMRCKRIPWEILRTDRLLVREMTEQDTESLYEIQKDDEAKRFLEPLADTLEEEREKVRAYIERMYGFYEFGIWMVLEKETEIPVGRAGFSFWEDMECPELGYAIQKEYRRQGYAVEVLQAIVKYGFEELGFEEICARTDKENTASEAVLTKLGFEREVKCSGNLKEDTIWRKRL